MTKTTTITTTKTKTNKQTIPHTNNAGPSIETFQRHYILYHPLRIWMRSGENHHMFDGLDVRTSWFPISRPTHVRNRHSHLSVWKVSHTNCILYAGYFFWWVILVPSKPRWSMIKQNQWYFDLKLFFEEYGDNPQLSTFHKYMIGSKASLIRIGHDLISIC